MGFIADKLCRLGEVTLYKSAFGGMHSLNKDTRETGETMAVTNSKHTVLRPYVPHEGKV